MAESAARRREAEALADPQCPSMARQPERTAQAQPACMAPDLAGLHEVAEACGAGASLLVAAWAQGPWLAGPGPTGHHPHHHPRSAQTNVIIVMIVSRICLEPSKDN